MVFQYPANIVEKDKKYFNSHLGQLIFEPRVHFLNVALVYKNGMAISLNGISEHTLPWKEWRGNYSKLFWIKSILKSFLTNSIHYSLSKKSKALVINPMSNNYFHWMTEVLPKILFLKSNGIDFSLLIHKGLSQNYQVETLRLLNVSAEYFTQDFTIISKAILVNNFSEYPGYYSLTQIDSVKSFFKHFNNLQSNVNSVQRIYISRKNASRRRVVNEDQILEFLKEKSFTVIDLENFSVTETYNILANAKFIVGIHGAGLTNIIFAPKECIVCEFLLENTIIDKCYFNLANSIGLEYNYIMCKSEGGTQDHINENYFVPIYEIENFINSYNL